MLSFARSRTFRAAPTAALLLALAACSGREEEYSFATPEETVASIRRMIENGDADRLPEAVLVEGERERELFARLGRLMNAIGVLAEESRAAFPEDIAAIRAELEAARAAGRDETIFGKLSSGELFRELGFNPMAPGRGSRPRGGGFGPLSSSGVGGLSRERLRGYMLQLLAVPDAWIEQGRLAVTTAYVNDEQAAVLWNGRPVIPMLGLVLQRTEPADSPVVERTGWYLVPPTRAPLVQTFAPRTDVQFEIAGEGIAAAENVVGVLTERVRSGRIRSAEQLAEEALDALWLPLGGVAMAYFSTMRPEGEAAEAAPGG